METKDKFDIHCDKDSLKIRFSSTMDNVDGAVEKTKTFLEEKGLSSNVFAISLVMREGLTNAVKHGNVYNLDKTVNYSLSIKDKRLIMEIEDEGMGFDWRTEKKRQIDTHSDHGRGLHIIQQYFSDFTYNDSGNKMILKKDLG